MKSYKKILVLAVAALLLVAVSVGGTLAWLTDKTDPVTNAFAPALVDISLTETWNTASKENGELDSWTAKMIPGATYKKDPKVTVETGSEKCYLFIEVVETDTGNAINWEQAEGWSKVEGATPKHIGGVVYMWKQPEAAGTSVYFLKGEGEGDLKNGKVTIDNDVTAETAKAELKFYAYAVQSENLKEDSGAAITEPGEIWKLTPSVP